MAESGLNEMQRHFLSIVLATKYFDCPDEVSAAYVYLYSIEENPFISEKFTGISRKINDVESFRKFLEDAYGISKVIGPEIGKVFSYLSLQTLKLVTGIYVPEEHLKFLSKTDDNLLYRILKQYREKILPKAKELIKLSDREIVQKISEEISKRNYKRAKPKN